MPKEGTGVVVDESAPSSNLSNVRTPILLLGFNRPDLVAERMRELELLQPAVIYVSIDGPRADRPEDWGLVEQVRDIVDAPRTWQCEFHLTLHPKNLGLVSHTLSAIDWVFETEDRLVLLEDDCSPGDQFLRYQSEILETYKNDQRVWCVLGDNSAKIPVPGGYSYTFSRYAMPTWGMGIWKRSWVNYDRDLKIWKRVRGTPILLRLWKRRSERRMMSRLLDRLAFGDRHSWAYSWLFSVHFFRGLAVVPRTNQVSNVGFNRTDAIHTVGNSLRANYPTSSIGELSHPPTVRRDYLAERVARDGRLFGLKKSRLTYRMLKKAKKLYRRWKKLYRN